MSNPELSLKLFNEGVAMKRLGFFSEAIELEKKSIRVYPDDPKIVETFYALGKVHYLAKHFSESIACYKVYLYLCMVKNSMILDDYFKAVNGDQIAFSRLVGTFRNYVHNLGHAAMDEKNQGQYPMEVKWYYLEVMGKKPYADSTMAPYERRAEEYDNQVIENGYNIMEAWMKEYAENVSVAKQDLIELMRYLSS